VAFAALALAPAARLARWDAAFLPPGYVVSAIVWVVVTVGCQVLVARRLPNRDRLILPIVMFLSGWGLALVWRLAPAFGLRQTIWLAVAAACMVVVVYSPSDLRWLRRYRYLWLTAALLLTALTLLVGINPAGDGPALWLGAGFLFFQPSEALKLLFVVFMAAYLSERVPLAANVSKESNFTLLAPLLLMWGLSLLILVSQRDLGTGSLIFAVFVATLYLATGQWRYVVVGSILLLVGAVLAYLLFDVVRIRVDAWINPYADASGRSFQIIQSLIAVANGGLFGRGFGVGAPTVIPVVHSDFVFAAVIEEWGLIGGLAALILLLILIARGLRMAYLARSAFRRLLAGGLATLLGLQTLLIVGGVIKVLPLTGVTLPFMSYGGSSLLVNFFIAGLLLKLSDDDSI
jgi:cell division protein FtsW (lipid II flippase)